jgi:hypothetical protein
MKKFSILLCLLCLILTANAGYIKRGISTLVAPNDIKNFTLAFDSRGNPIAAGSMHSSLAGPPSTGCNSIVIVHTNTNQAQLFPIVLGTEEFPEDFHIKVLDFHYERFTNSYILCGVRGENSPYRSYAFVARIDAGFTTIEYADIHDSEKLYSIWGNFDGEPTPLYYACGPTYILGIHPVSLMPAGPRYAPELFWIYHKIVGKWGTEINPKGWTLIVSGTDTEHTLAGFAMFDPQNPPPSTYFDHYYWEQPTDSEAHCVVADDIVNKNQIVLATSCPDIGVSLHHIDINQLQGTTYTSLRGGRQRHVVQDIASNREGVSVAGYFAMYPNNKAWYGHYPTATGFNIINNNDYYVPAIGDYEHYKVKYDNIGKVYTGGYFGTFANRGVLFGSPQEPSECDDLYSDRSWKTKFLLERVDLTPMRRTGNYPFSFETRVLTMPYEYICREFSEEETSPDFILPFEKESDITTSYDYISVKNLSINTAYQIFAITGQLLQSGFSSPNISTTNLCKGIYILRLENGETYKFVK